MEAGLTPAEPAVLQFSSGIDLQFGLHGAFEVPGV